MTEEKNALQNLWDLSLDPELRREARAIDKWERDQRAEKRCAQEKGHREGLQEGMEKGIEKGMKRVALKMLKSGFSVEIIKENTGLSEDEIKALKRCS